jgi:hypothetical protein
MPRGLRIAGVAVLAIVLIAAAAFQFVQVGVTEHYSPGWMSESSADAARRGLLRARPALTAQRQFFRGDTLVLAEAWVEQATRVEYQWYLRRRVVQLPQYRLVLRAAPTWRATDYSCDQRLVYADSIELGESQSRFFVKVGLRPPFPDTVRVRVIARSSDPQCHATAAEPA